MNRILNFFCAGLVMLSLIGSIGCGSGSSPEAAIREANKTNLQRLSNLYGFYQIKRRLKGPKDEADFKSFLRGTGSDVLKTIGVKTEEVDKLFISERDGQPFKIRYQVPTTSRGSSEAVVFEATGRNGKRLVGFLDMVQREVEDAEYESLLNAKIGAPPRG